MSSSGELQHALDAIRWGTDWFLKAFHGPTTLYAQVGDGNSDHACWARPETMDTPRTVYKIDQNNPGSDLAGETAAALAAASMALSASDPSYANTLLDNAKQLFQFADQYRGVYSDSIPQVQNFYNSFSGYKDELLWAAAWLHRATGDGTYLAYVDTNAQALNGLGSITELSWDNKLAAAQILLSRQVLHCGASSQNLQQMKQMAEQYVCAYVNGGVQTTSDGLAWVRQWAPLQYSNNAAFVSAVYSDYLAEAGQSLTCGGKTFTPDQIIAWSKSQVDYVLGKNNAGQSFMVGFGSKYPQRMHHRGASIPVTQTPYSCGEGFQFMSTSNADPNLIMGAISGGPAQDGSYADDRNRYEQSEPITYINAGFLGAVARLVRGTSGVNAACTAAGGGGSNPAPATTPSPPVQTPAPTTGAPAQTPSTSSQTQSPTSAPSQTPSPPADTPSTPSQTSSPPADTPSTPSQTPSPPADTPSTPSLTSSPPTDTPGTPSQTPSPPADTPSTPSQTPSPPANTPSTPSETPASTPSTPASTPSSTPSSTPGSPASTPSTPASTPSTPSSTPSTPSSTPGSPASTPSTPASPSTPTSTTSAPTSAPSTSTGASFTITSVNDAAWTSGGQKVSLYTVVVKNTSGQTFQNVAIACNNFHPDQYWNIMKGGTDGDCSVPTWMSSFAPGASLTFGYIQTGSGAQFSINL